MSALRILRKDYTLIMLKVDLVGYSELEALIQILIIYDILIVSADKIRNFYLDRLLEQVFKEITVYKHKYQDYKYQNGKDAGAERNSSASSDFSAAAF